MVGVSIPSNYWVWQAGEFVPTGADEKLLLEMEEGA